MSMKVLTNAQKHKSVCVCVSLFIYFFLNCNFDVKQKPRQESLCSLLPRITVGGSQHIKDDQHCGAGL